MQKENTKLETPNGAIDVFYYFNHLVWLTGVLLFLWAIIGGERTLINAAVVLAVVYLLKE